MAATYEDFEGQPTDAARYWREQIALSKKRRDKFAERGKRVMDKFKDQGREDDHRFNILWSNTEIQKSAVLSSLPRPDITRRFKDDDDIARDGSEILSRCVSFLLDDTGAMEVLEAARDDALLPGWGVVRVQYDAKFDEIEDDDGEVFESIKRPGTDTVRFVYEPWDALYLSDAERWEDCYWIAFRHEMRKAQLEEQFGEYDKDTMPLTLKEADGSTERAEVFEVWDKDNRERIWFAMGATDIIESEEDPLGLDGFYPIPRPLAFLRLNDTPYPIAEYLMYQDQAKELNEVNRRIVKLVGMLKVAGLYDAVAEKVEDLVNLEDGQLIPISTGGEMRAKGGLEQCLFFLPINHIAEVVTALFTHREGLKQQIYELTGISDLMRGATDAGETAQAQHLKAQFGATRNQRKTRPMQIFARDCIRLMAEVVAEHFDESSLAAMTGMNITPEVMQLFRNDRLRRFRIDIETGSTVAADMAEEKQEMTEFVTAVTQFMQTAASAPPQAMPMMMELLKQVVRRFQFGRRMEEVIEQTADQIVQASQQPPGPDPTKVAEIKAKLEERQMQEMGENERAMLELIGDLLK